MSRRLPLAFLLSLSLLTGCDQASSDGADPGSRVTASNAGPDLVDTGVKTPNACGLVSEALSEHLVGVKQGDRDPDDSKASASSCEWDSSRAEKASASGLLIVSVQVQLKQDKDREKFHTARVYFRGLKGGKNCRDISLGVDESCWFQGEQGVGLVLRRGYVTVLASYNAAGVARQSERESVGTVKRLANDITNGLRAQ